ncbi:MAG: hypothetical protein HPM95_06475 [Alphaproteobacteria bacterium]|nr:hypothetical protein [Alphaproteobacteria bacterium]
MSDKFHWNLSKESALQHWYSGNGEPVTVGMAGHMNSGGGSVFNLSSFESTIARHVRSADVGDTITFETNIEKRELNGYKQAVSSIHIIVKIYYLIILLFGEYFCGVSGDCHEDLG